MNALIILVGVISAMIIRHEWLIHRIRCCDACRIDSMGGQSVSIPHTCSRSRALYRDRKGDVYEFGKFVRHEIAPN